jgi:hypothetical protein
MKFGKFIWSQQEVNTHLHYVEYKALKNVICDVVENLKSSDIAQALTTNTRFEETLAAEIGRVNECFAQRQQELLKRAGDLSDGVQRDNGSGSSRRPEALRRLVELLAEVDQLRKYAVWNAVAVVKILKKRRKQTSFGLEDVASEKAGWLSRQSFFSGSEFAELHAAVESLGHVLVLSELELADGAAPRPELAPRFAKEPQQCPICLDNISDVIELPCSHRFCWKCFVLKPIAFQPGEYRITQCPICRKETLGVDSAGGGVDAVGGGGAQGSGVGVTALV